MTSLPAGERRKAAHDGTITVELRFASRAALLDAPSPMEPTHFDQVDTECVEPGQQALQRRAVDYLAA
jgi:hypothetical protein